MSEEEIINLFYKYNLAILNYKNFIKDIYENYYYYSNVIYKGYLIELKYLKKWKEVLSYKKLKTCLNCPYDFIKNEIKKYCDFNKLNDLEKEEQVKYQNARYLISMMLNNNEFVIITEDLYKLICSIKNKNREEPFITYTIRYLYLDANLNNDILTFSHNKNILNIKSLVSQKFFQLHKYYYNDIIKISKSIYEYYKFSETIFYYLNESYLSKGNTETLTINSESLVSQSKKNYFFGYLIEYQWIDDWMNYINYNFYKKECIGQNDIIKDDIIIEKLANKIIYDNEDKKINFLKIINSIQLLQIKSEKELKSFLQNDSIVIINKNFLQLFMDEDSIKSYNLIRFCAYNKTIVFYLENNKMIFNTDDNIISKDEHQNKILKTLIQIFCFQEELKQKIKLPFQENNINSYSVNIINKNAIKNYKEYYHYKELCSYLKSDISIFKPIEEENNLINHNLLNDDIILDMVRHLPKEFIELIMEKELLKKYKTNSINRNSNNTNRNFSPKYLTNFEIINFHQLNAFKSLNFGEDCKYYPGECYICDEKIVVIIQDNDIYYYQIGYIDNNDNIITEYYIDATCTFDPKLFSNIFISKSITSFLKDVYKDKKNNSFNLNNNQNLVFYCHKIGYDENDANKKETYILQKNINKFAKIILSFLFFNENFKKEIQNSISNINERQFIGSFSECYLIKKENINEYRKLFLYGKFCKYIKDNNLEKSENIEKALSKYMLNNSKIYFKNLFSNNNQKFEKLFNNKNLYSLELNEMKDEYNNIIYYPDDIELINENIYDNNFVPSSKEIQAIENVNIINKIQYIVNEGKIIIKFHDNILIIGNLNTNNYHNLFKSEILLYFNRKEECLNHFIKLIKENYSKVISELVPNESQDNDIKNNRGKTIGKYYKTNINKMENFNGMNIQVLNNNNLKYYLRLLIKLIIGYESMKNKINKNIKEEQTDFEDYYYFISKKYIDEFNDIFNIKEIYDIINNNKHFFINYYFTFEESMINKLISLLPESIIYYFCNFNKSRVKKLNDRKLYLLSVYEYITPDQKKLKYFNNVNIFNKDILLIFQKIDEEFQKIKKYEEIKCLIGDKKIFMRLNNENNFIINIGHINKENTFFSELLINSFLFRNISFIFDMIKKNGNKYIDNALTNNAVDKLYDNNQLIAYIYKNEVSAESTLNLDFPNISSKLLTLLLISIYQFIIIKKQEQNIIRVKDQMEDVYLINNKCINDYILNKISNLIINNSQISKILSNSNFNLNDQKVINNIIKSLNSTKLNEIDKDISQMTTVNRNISLLPYGEDVKISKTRYVKIYKEFLLLNKNLLIKFEKNFNMRYDSSTNYKFFINRKSILTISNQEQNIILIGSFKNNIFNINYILDYKNSKTLMNQMEIITQDYNNYIKNNLIFNENVDSDYVSPIFDISNSIIGFGYKYNDKSKNDYSGIYFSNDLVNIIRLYIFYRQINYKINNTNTHVNTKFCLINKDWISRYKTNHDYTKLNNEILNNNNNILYLIKSYIMKDFDSINMRIIFLAIKNMEYDFNRIFNEKNELIKNQYNSYLSVEPEKIKINYFNNNQQSQSLTTYKNFEIINSEFGKTLNDNNKILCNGIINNGKIAINLPFSLNNKDTWIVGILNNDNTFVTQYFLIYNMKNDAYSHIQYVCKYIGLDNYLSKFKLIDNSQLIINEKQNIIGIIVKNEDNNYKI